MHPRFKTFEESLDEAEDGQYVLFEAHTGKDYNSSFKAKHIVELKTVDDSRSITYRDDQFSPEITIPYHQVERGYGERYILSKLHDVKTATKMSGHLSPHSLLHTVMQRENFEDNLTTVAKTITGVTYIYKMYKVEINGTQWSIVCPIDKSFFLAIAEGGNLLSFPGENVPQMFTRQWEWSGFGNRIPAKHAREHWTVYGMRDFDLLNLTSNSSNGGVKQSDKMYDLFLLHTQDPVAINDPDMNRITITRRIVDSLKTFGNIYNQQKDKTYKLFAAEEFQHMSAVKTNFFEHLESGYYWMTIPGKYKALVWLISDIQSFYYTANVSTIPHHLSSLPRTTEFISIAQ